MTGTVLNGSVSVNDVRHMQGGSLCVSGTEENSSLGRRNSCCKGYKESQINADVSPSNSIGPSSKISYW